MERVHGRISRLLYKLEDLHVRDVMTGVYNRRGLTFANEYLKQCVGILRMKTVQGAIIIK